MDNKAIHHERISIALQMVSNGNNSINYNVIIITRQLYENWVDRLEWQMQCMQNCLFAQCRLGGCAQLPPTCHLTPIGNSQMMMMKVPLIAFMICLIWLIAQK